ncbi:MAG: hypothetical protein KDE27_07475, partial [Planctomycetes bacterium]|nr:hypothetical protein [Planctomycetota bacterium]
MSNRRWLAGPWPLACLTLLALALPVLLSGCSRSGGGGPAPGPVGPVGDWGPIPPGPRGPGTVAIAASRTIEVRNVGGERTQTLRASVPFSWGETSDPNLFSIEGRPTAWLVLQRWPDRTVRIAQAQWTETVPAAATLTRAVVAQPTALAGPFVPHAVFAGGLPELGAEVQDAFGVVYDAAVAGPGDVVQETPLVRVRRWRVYHTAATGGIGRDFLTSTFYVTELRDQPVAIVDWLPGNDYLGADAPGSADPNLHALGGVDVDDVSFRCRGVDLTLPYRAGAEGVAAGVNGVDGYTRFSAMQQTWIADGQMRRYRFLLLRDDPAANAGARAAARATATLMAEQPLRPLCDHDSLRVTAALGLLGGPGPAPAD